MAFTERSRLTSVSLVSDWYVRGQDALQGRVLLLDRGHRVVDGLAEVVALLQTQQVGEPRLLGEVEDSPGLVVGLTDLPAAGAAARQLCLRLAEPTVGELQEDQP